jgi:hypothetical protein
MAKLGFLLKMFTKWVSQTMELGVETLAESIHVETERFRTSWTHLSWTLVRRELPR